MTERIAPATVHGRYLISPPAEGNPGALLVGFHGYAEDAETQMDRLRAIPESAHCLCVSIQALHPFYVRRTGQIVANWMTSQNRDLAIADNLAWVASTLRDAAESIPGAAPATKTFFAGFSQGVAMAWRAAAHLNNPALRLAGVIAVGGDIPPELTPESLARIPAALLIRGAADDWYTNEKQSADAARLHAASVAFRTIGFDGGHAWPPDVSAAASAFLREHLI